jgi:hypothetical protein
MKHERQVKLLKETIAHIDANTTPMSAAPYWRPAARYTSHEHYRIEKERLFGGQVPLLAGFSPDLPEPHGRWQCQGAPEHLPPSGSPSACCWCARGGSAPIDVLRETFGMHEWMGEFGFANFHFYQEVFWDFAANWKLLMETVMEV